MPKSLILVFLASTRQGRFGETVAKWLQTVYSQRTAARYEFVDLRDWIFPYIDEPGQVAQIEMSYADNDPRKAWREKITAADGFVIITPEYNHGYPAVLKTALDAVYTAWNKKPVAFVSYGGVSGGTRAVEQLRTVAVELQLAPVTRAVHMPFVKKSFDEQGKLTNPAPEVSARNMFEQLEWWATVLKEGRERYPVVRQVVRPV